MSGPKIAKQIGISTNQVQKYANKIGLKSGPRPSIYPTNEGYFRSWSPKMAYLLGFILAYGCISLSDNRYRLIIALQEKDKDQIEWLRNELSPTKPISYNNTSNAYELRISNELLVRSLIDIGIMPRKSHLNNIPTVPQPYKMHFLRGVFDGDGCLYVRQRQRGKYISKDCRWQITAKNMQYLINLKKEVGVDIGYIKPVNTWHNWYIGSSKEIIYLCNKMYECKNESWYMKRKYNKFMELISLYE